MKKHTLKIGDKVKLTGKFLKSTGQITGHAGLDTWTVLGFWGQDNSMVITNEPRSPKYIDMMWPDLTENEKEAPSIKYHCYAAGNLFKVGTLTTRNCP